MILESLEGDFGPRARGRARVASVIAAVGLALIAGYTLYRFMRAGHLDYQKWAIFLDGSGWPFVLGGIVNTFKVAVVDGLLAVAIGMIVALGQLSRRSVVRRMSVLYAETFISLPTLLLILFIYFGAAGLGLAVNAYWSIVLGSAVYNGAVLGNIFKAGVLSVERGQLDASYALGLRYWKAMQLIIGPQAFRRVLPATVSQLIVLLKDSSLGFFIGYDELLQRSQQLGAFEHNFLQAYSVAAVLYFVMCFGLSRVARLLERRGG